MKDTMCGIVKEVNGPGGLVYHTDLPIPQIGEDEILIKVHCSAICGTDMHILEWDDWSQKRIKAPVTLGHETAGDVVAVGSAVKDRKVGDRVSCESHIPCGDCYFCKNGMPHICKNVKLFGCTQNGAFAEYAKIRCWTTASPTRPPACLSPWARVFTAWRPPRWPARPCWSAAAAPSA